MATPARATWAKTHSTAVCLVPPRSLWPRIQESRVFHDKSFTRWPPHINLLYPFVEATHLEEAAQAAAHALRPFSAFQVTLRELQFFEHGRSCTLWAQPESPELLAVQAALVSAFPLCSDLSSDPSRGITSFTPHLSLGQWRTKQAVAEAAEAARRGGWAEPATFTAGGVALLSRAGFLEPFSVRWWVPFGGGAPLQMDVPYIASMGEAGAALLAIGSGAGAGAAGGTGAGGAAAAAPLAALQQQAARSDFGLGGLLADGSVWQFAYGANMAPSKLGGARGIHPLESLPALLPGWRLAFTHRGGMGSLQRLAPGEAAPAGLPGVHGVLHRLSAGDYGRLINMEHEYLPVEVEAQPYGGAQPLPAVALVTPTAARIADGLPPPQRYLALLQEGARHWGLEPRYRAHLDSMPSVDSRDRGAAYYTAAASGEPLPALPKIRTGSQPRQGRGGGRGGGRGRGGGGRRGGKATE